MLGALAAVGIIGEVFFALRLSVGRKTSLSKQEEFGYDCNGGS